MERKEVSKSVLKRLPGYLSYLKTLPDGTATYISATALANALGMGEVQVRKDLAMVSDGGRPKVGYLRERLMEDISQFLGYDNTTDAIMIGAGKLGKALMGYKGFEAYGLNIQAAFLCFLVVAGELLVSLVITLFGYSFMEYTHNFSVMLTLIIWSKLLYMVFAAIGALIFSPHKQDNTEPGAMPEDSICFAMCSRLSMIQRYTLVPTTVLNSWDRWYLLTKNCWASESKERGSL